MRHVDWRLNGWKDGGGSMPLSAAVAACADVSSPNYMFPGQLATDQFAMATHSKQSSGRKGGAKGARTVADVEAMIHEQVRRGPDPASGRGALRLRPCGRRFAAAITARRPLPLCGTFCDPLQQMLGSCKDKSRSDSADASTGRAPCGWRAEHTAAEPPVQRPPVWQGAGASLAGKDADRNCV